MVKVIILFGMPADHAEFDQYFNASYRPLLSGSPNGARVTFNRIAGAAKGDSPYHLIAEIEFPSEEAMQVGLNSEEGQTMARDLSHFGSGGVTVLFSETLVEQSFL